MSDASRFIRPHILALEGYQPILPFEVLSNQLGRAPQEIIKLDANENPYGPVPAVREALSNLPYPHIYPDPDSTALRQALSAVTGQPMENILAAAGADELIDLIMRLILEPGEAVLTCPPTFGMYAFDAEVNNAHLIEVPRRQSFALDLKAIEQAVNREKPKLFFLASPNNPDGSLVSRAEMKRILDLPLIVVLDEAYIEYARPGASHIGEVARRENLIVLRTFSKWAALAGLRVGYGVFPASIMPHLWKIKQPYNVSVAASAAALASLEHLPQLQAVGQRIVAERERLFSALQGVSYLESYPSQANFILCRVRGRDAIQLKNSLTQRGILIRYFDKPGLQDHIRISVGRPEHTDALLAALHELE